MLVEDEMDKFLMIPGPTPVHRKILTALGQPTISHTSGPLATMITPCLEGLRSLAGADGGQAFVFGGSGTLAQEAALVNLVAPGERVIVASNGYFGDRFLSIARAHGMEVEHISSPWGSSVTPGQLREALSGAGARAVTITHVETSTGVMAPVAELAAVAKDAGAFVILDAVCSLGGVPVRLDEWGVDVVLSGAQKALGVPPGLALLVVSSRALGRRRTMGSISSYYADLLNWEASMADPTVYFSTHSVNLFYALSAALTLIQREGVEQRYARHRQLSAALRSGFQALGFRLLTDPEFVAPTLSVFAYPQDIDDTGFRAALSRRGVVAAACLGPFKGKGLRIGHMGNITSTEILQTVQAAESALIECGGAVSPGAGLAAAQAVLAERQTAYA